MISEIKYLLDKIWTDAQCMNKLVLNIAILAPPQISQVVKSIEEAYEKNLSEHNTGGKYMNPINLPV